VIGFRSRISFHCIEEIEDADEVQDLYFSAESTHGEYINNIWYCQKRFPSGLQSTQHTWGFYSRFSISLADTSDLLFA